MGLGHYSIIFIDTSHVIHRMSPVNHDMYVHTKLSTYYDFILHYSMLITMDKPHLFGRHFCMIHTIQSASTDSNTRPLGSTTKKKVTPQVELLANSPLSVASASITASMGGGSTALARKGPMGPSLSSLMDKASSWSGVRKISGVVCWSSLKISTFYLYAQEFEQHQMVMNAFFHLRWIFQKMPHDSIGMATYDCNTYSHGIY